MPPVVKYRDDELMREKGNSTNSRYTITRQLPGHSECTNCILYRNDPAGKTFSSLMLMELRRETAKKLLLFYRIVSIRPVNTFNNLLEITI